MLIGGAETAVEGEYLGVRHPPREGLLGVTDLVLTAQKDQHVARGFARQLVEGGGDALQGVEVFLHLRLDSLGTKPPRRWGRRNGGGFL